MGSQLHASQPNEVIHADFLYMGESANSDLKYVLIIRDDLSSYVCLWPTASATSESASDALIQWYSTFGSSKWLVTDQGLHFTAGLFKEMKSELRIGHHYTTAYCPWANVSVERVCREVKRACSSLLSEFKLSPLDLPAVLECVTSVLNHAPLERLGLRNKGDPGVYRTPLEVFTSHIPSRPLLRALPLEDNIQVNSITEARAHQLLMINEIQDSLEAIHKDVERRSKASLERAIARHNEKTNVLPVNFGKGDFVLIRKPHKKGHKLQHMWRGPKRITDVKSEFVFVVDDLLSGKTEEAHVRRMLLYRADMDGKEVDERLIQQSQHLSTTYQVVANLHDIRERDEGMEIRVGWDGLPDQCDNTWEPLKKLLEDVPDLVRVFLDSEEKREMKRKASSLIFR